MNLEHGYTYSFKRGLKPPPKFTVSEWADTHRQLPKSASAEPGQWRTSRTPYLREIMDSLTPNNGIQKVVFVKPTQIGGTETGNNWIGFTIEHSPVPMMMVLPTVELGKRSSRQRIKPMIESTPTILPKMKKSSSRDTGGQSVMSKEFEGGILIITGANSGVGLRSMPCCNLFFDELDGYPLDVDGEGSPIDIAQKRTDTFQNKKKIFYNSTPTTEAESQIMPLYYRTDQRKYYVPCPHCHEYQTLTWAQIKWKGQKTKLDVWYECEFCQNRIDEHQKTWMLENGEWRATQESEEDGMVGYHLNALYSPVGWFSWKQAAIEFFKAKAASDRKDFTKMKTFVNTVLGETWDENQGESISDDVLFNRREDYKVVPSDAFILTCGVDVQEDRLELEVVAWGKGEESWGTEYRVIHGDTTQQDTWDELSKFLQTPIMHDSGQPLRILCTCVDSGYLTKTVYAFAEQHKYMRVFATKGVSGDKRPLLSAPNYKSGPNSKKIALYSIGVDEAKRILYNRLRIAVPGTGYCHFPTTYNEEYFKQLTAEKLVKKYKRGFTFFEWQKTRPRNEALDIRVLNMIALTILNPNWDYAESDIKTAVKKTKEDEEAVSKGEKIQRTTPPRRRVRSRGIK